VFNCFPELRAAAYLGGTWKPEIRHFLGIRCFRPLLRLRERVLLPPGVLILARNPIFFALFRLLGLYVGNIMV